jgi:mono/diheme cytochrome c family protein
MRQRTILPAMMVCAAFVMCAGTVGDAFAVDPSGKELYLKYCGACHGPEAKGDGVVSQLMRPQPTDLTQVAKRNGGEFPVMKMMRIIDGRETPRGHGDADMPVWGEVLQSAGDEDVHTKGVVMQITEFLRTVQVK